MYNGIGLATVRGSGTNGYVSRNLAFVSATRATQAKTGGQMEKFSEPSAPKQPNAEIVHHMILYATTSDYRSRGFFECETMPKGSAPVALERLLALLAR